MQDRIDWMYRKYWADSRRAPETFARIMRQACEKFNVTEEEFIDEIFSRI